MSAPSLRDYAWQISYGPSDDRLNQFYIPALSRSVRYDRMTGYFSSSSLAIAAAGVAGLIANGGTMRLLVGAQLEAQDVEAIKRGESTAGLVSDKLLAALNQPIETVMQQRLEVLAWMVAQGTLDIKVVLPVDEYGNPLSAQHAMEYFHAKEAVFTDADGNQLAFSGSINESMTGWQRNYEQFNVYFSWESSKQYLAQVKHRFDRLWNGQEDWWTVLDVPDAARQALLKYAPEHAPTHDPVAHATRSAAQTRKQRQRDAVLFRFLKDAPHLINSQQLGMATAAITPWPHQVNVSQSIITSYPHSYMLCDEVGLGKTIEAGLVLRQLLLSGYVKRCLLLVPKSVARQWQEELYEKFVLDIPLYDGQKFHNYAGEELSWQHDTANPWDAFDVFIASSQLAKRKDRQQQVLSARPWDMVLVDEAHHARRKDFQARGRFRANHLLALLLDLQAKASSILLMTATPMQVHPLEVWDLLKVLGLGSKWGANEDNFLAFYEELRRSFDETEWDFVFEMVKDYLQYEGELDEEFARVAAKALGPVMWDRVKRLPDSHKPSQDIKFLPGNTHEYVREMAHRHTPLRRYMFRNTRELLREYVRKKLLDAKVPYRDPRPIWIPMDDDEKALYERIEEYISTFYRKYEQERRGLGFIMTVYRRRLTSSFYAIHKSLERRLQYLQGQTDDDSYLVDEDDIEQEELALDISDDMDGDARSLYHDEVEYLQDFVHALGSLAKHDSKTEQLFDDLRKVFNTRNTVIIFTQYTDSMDYLRDKLRAVYGSQVACYSGRGGEVWTGIGWTNVPKEQIKQAFREGEDIKILVCTEAASEGLNLQTCGVLINYDMPWNPMRVEQRIGRVDRIGQVHEKVWIYNYFYKDTIEARVYDALSARIDWFTDVVGELQPILAHVGKAIEKLVMTVPDEREPALTVEIDSIINQIDDRQSNPLNVYETTEAAQAWQGFSSPVLLADLEKALTKSSLTAKAFQPHPEITGAYICCWNGSEAAVTFDANVFDEYPNSLQLISYGNTMLDSLLGQFGEVDATEKSGILRCSVNTPLPLVAFYALNDSQEPVEISSVHSVNSALDGGRSTEWTDQCRVNAMQDFELKASAIAHTIHELAKSQREYTIATIKVQGSALLYRAAVLDRLIAEQKSDTGHQSNTQGLIDKATIQNIAIRRGYPLSALFALCADHLTYLDAGSSLFSEDAGKSLEQLTGILAHQETMAKKLLVAFQDAKDHARGGTLGDIDLEIL